MTHPREIYDLLLDQSLSNSPIQEMIIGLTWTLCKVEGMGLCMSPGIPTRTLSWSGTLVNKPASELTSWVKSWESYQATVGMAVINAIINSNSPLPQTAELLSPTGPANLAVFEHFLPQIRGKRVAIIGRYPELSRYEKEMNLVVIERQPAGGDLPDPACEFILPDCEWVFLTATSITNKTFPRLAELSKDATLVLMGPTLPWLSELAEMGVNYLAGVRVINPKALRQTVAEGGGTRIFDTGVQYCIQQI